jgi:hypothetical protein
MDSIDNVRERIEALEQQMKSMGAHTRVVERRLRWWRGIACGVGLLSLLSLAPSSQAADFTCTAGDVACLLDAITMANANGEENTITLAAGTYPLTVVDNTTDGLNGLPSVTSPLTIRGAGAGATVIGRVAAFFRLLHVATAGSLTLEGLTLSGGAPISSGGGIFNRGTLTLVSTALTDNMAGFFNSGGGGLSNEGGTVTIIDSTLARNSAGGGGGGLQNNGGTVTVTNTTFANNRAFGHNGSGSGGGLQNNGGTVTVINATFVGNGAGTIGGGVANFGGTVSLINSTLADNSTRGGGGVANFGGTVALQNTILAGNTAPGGGPDCTGPVTSLGTNVIGDARDCAITLQASDLVGNPRLGAFTDDGSPGGGHVPLLPTSPAIETGHDAACPSTDQLGQPRVGRCEIGAVEFQPPPGADEVTIRYALFVDELALLFVAATSSAAPDADLFVTVPGCRTHAAMGRIGELYALLQAVQRCGDLDGRLAVVTSSRGGAASAPLR